MKAVKLLNLAAAALMSMAFAGQAQALVIIDEVMDFYTVGDFEVYGNDVASGTGQNYEVLKFKPQGNDTTGTASDGSSLDTAPHGDVSIADLWGHLDANGLTSATKLGFGFDVNQNTDYVDVDALTITLYSGVNPFKVYSLTDTVRVYDGISGNGSSTAEARFIVNLDFDFMTAYNAGTPDDFKIMATLSSANSGFEEFFLSSVFSGGTVPPDASAVPEPATMLMLGAGLLAGVVRRKS
jgi:hypothetical protein